MNLEKPVALVAAGFFHAQLGAGTVGSEFIAKYLGMIPHTTPTQLTWTHCGLSFGKGFLYLPVLLVLVLAFAFALYMRPEKAAAFGLLPFLKMSPAYLLAMLILAVVLLGVPALLGALVRVPAMRALFAHCRRQALGQVVGGALLGTFLVFEAVVLLAAYAPLANAHSKYFDY